MRWMYNIYKLVIIYCRIISIMKELVMEMRESKKDQIVFRAKRVVKQLNSQVSQNMKQLNSKRIQQLKQSIYKYPEENPIYFYTVAIKQSASSLFSNERILFINARDKTINYANIQKNEPFIGGVEPKLKGTMLIPDKNFKYMKVKQKEPSIRVWQQQSAQNQNRIQQWKFQFFNINALLEFIHIINYIYSQVKSSAKASGLAQSEAQNKKSSMRKKQMEMKLDDIEQSKQDNKNEVNSNKVQTSKSPIHQLENLHDQKLKLSQAEQKQNLDSENAFILNNSMKQQYKEEDFEDKNLQKGEENKANQNFILDQLGGKKKEEVEKKPNVPLLNISQLRKQLQNQKGQKKKISESYSDESSEEITTHNILLQLQKGGNTSNQNLSSLNGGNKSKGTKDKGQKTETLQERKKRQQKKLDNLQISTIPNKNSYNPHFSLEGKGISFHLNEGQAEQQQKNQQKNESKNKNVISFNSSLLNKDSGKSISPLSKNHGKEKIENLQSPKPIISEGLSKVQKKQDIFKSEKGDGGNFIQNGKKSNASLGSQINKRNEQNNLNSASFDQPRKYVDWNRKYFESNYSVDVYQQFVETSLKYFFEQLPFHITSIFDSHTSLFTFKFNDIVFEVYRYHYSEPQHLPTFQLKQQSKQLNVQSIVDLYCSNKNKLQQRAYTWRSNRWIMQKLLEEKNRKVLYKQKIRQPLINRITVTMGCWFQYLGLAIYSFPFLNDNQYALQENWQLVPAIRKLLFSLQEYIGIQIPSESFSIYKRLYSSDSYLLSIFLPIHLIGSEKHSLFTSYINELTIQKNSPEESLSKSIFTRISASSLRQTIMQKLELDLASKLNRGISQQIPQKVYSCCGSKQFLQILQYFNVGEDKKKRFYQLLTVDYYKKLLTTQICADIFVTLLIYHFHCEIYNMLLAKEKQSQAIIQKIIKVVKNKKANGVDLSQVQGFYEKLVFTWLNNLLSYHYPQSDILWHYIDEILRVTHQISCQNRTDKTIPGYMIDFCLQKLGIRLQYANLYGNNKKQLDQTGFNTNKIPEESTSNFPFSLSYCYLQPNVLSFLNPIKEQQGQKEGEKQSDKDEMKTIEQTIKIEQYRGSRFSFIFCVLEAKIFDDLVNKFICKKQTASVVSGILFDFSRNLKQEQLDLRSVLEQLAKDGSFPLYFQYLEPYFRLYLSQFISLTQSKKFEHIKIYNPLDLPLLSRSQISPLVPHSNIQLQTYIQIIKYLLDESELNFNNIKSATYLVNSVLEENVFWQAEYNPYAIKIYVMMSDFWVLQKDYTEAIKYYKSALLIYLKYYSYSDSMGDRHFYLAVLLSTSERYSQAIKELENAAIKYLNKIEFSLDDQKHVSRKQVIKKNNKTLSIKYIRCLVLISKIYFRVAKIRDTRNQITPFRLSTELISQIITPLCSIINQLKQVVDLSQQKFVLPKNLTLRHIQMSPPFVRNGIIQIYDVIEETIEIFQIIYRCFFVAKKIPQLNVLISEDLLSVKVLQSFLNNNKAFKRALRMILEHQFIINRSISKKNLQSLKEMLGYFVEKGEGLSRYEAHKYISQKYSGRKNEVSLQKQSDREISPNSNRSIKSRNRSRSRSKSKTSKKSEYPQILLFVKRTLQYMKRANELWQQAKRYRMLNKHIPFNHYTKNQFQEFLVIGEVVSLVVGYEFMFKITSINESYFYGSVNLGEGPMDNEDYSSI